MQAQVWFIYYQLNFFSHNDTIIEATLLKITSELPRLTKAEIIRVKGD